jgi:hypothetical protein
MNFMIIFYANAERNVSFAAYERGSQNTIRRAIQFYYLISVSYANSRHGIVLAIPLTPATVGPSHSVSRLRQGDDIA